MEEYNESDNQTEMLITSGEWTKQKAEDLIKKYNACKTEHERVMLLPQLENMLSRLAFEKKEIDKLL